MDRSFEWSILDFTIRGGLWFPRFRGIRRSLPQGLPYLVSFVLVHCDQNVPAAVAKLFVSKRAILPNLRFLPICFLEHETIYKWATS